MRPGEVGTIRIVRANGQIRAQARMRDESGALRRLKTARATEAEARRASEEQAEAIGVAVLGRRWPLIRRMMDRRIRSGRAQATVS